MSYVSINYLKNDADGQRLTLSKNFAKYVQYMESQGAHKAGVAKIIPPKGTFKVEWTGIVYRTYLTSISVITCPTTELSLILCIPDINFRMVGRYE